MEDELNFQVGISGDGLTIKETAAAVENMQEAEQERAVLRQQNIEQEEKKAEANKPEGANLGDYIADTVKAPIAGVRDGVANIITAPERVIDFVSGEMQEEAETEEGYQTEWDSLLYGDNDPLETKTWWGGVIRTATEVGTTLGLTGGFGAVGKVGKGLTFAQSLKTGALTGARFDLLDKDSQDDNLAGMLKEKFPLLDTPLATKDGDSPIMKTMKNVVEGMMIGGIFDSVLYGVAKGLPKAQIAEAVNARKKSVKSQQLEEAATQMKEPGFRASKNPKLANKSQGATTSLETGPNLRKAKMQKKTDLGSEEGSIGSAISNTELTALTKGTKEARKVIENVLRRFRSQGYVQQMKETAARQGLTLDEMYMKDLDTYKQVFEGRNTSDFTPEEFWKKISAERFERKSEDNFLYSFIAPEYADAIDMINASLFNEIRDAGVSARELANIYDIKDIDGPAQNMVKKLIAGLRMRKMASSEAAQNLREFGKLRGKPVTRKLQDEMLDKSVQESVNAFRMALDISTEDGGDEIFKAMFEGISMAKNINTLDDLDAFMRVKMRGGEWGGDAKKTGAFLREMGSMFTHSVLSGPKTAVRAIMGTSTATFSRPLAMAMGGLMKGDGTTMRAGLASLNAMREAIPESFELFKRKLNSYWAGDISTMKTRYVERTKQDDQWTMYGHWAETRGDATDKALYRTANMVRGLNDNSFLTYSTKIMASTDDAFALIIGRARAREKAFLQAADKLPDGNFQNLDNKFFRDMEDNFNSQIFDSNGNITDKMAEYSRKEATLTQDLTGFSQKLGEAFNEAPWARPFFLFARTGINGLALTAKYTPGFNLLVSEFNQIAKAKPGDNLQSLHKYGIHNTHDLMTAKAVQNGRLAIGGAALSMASMAYLSGNLHGNGPTDRTQRQAWKDAGWRPREIKIGNVWVNYDAFEPYNQILALIGDIGDHQELMGEEWAEDRYSKLAMALASTATSKSYLAGLQSFVDLFSGAPGQQDRIIASLMNNTLPLSSLRNEIGKVLTPYTRELGSDIGDSIRNRNLITENIAGDPLPIKYDILTGRPIKDHIFPVRMFNAISPVNFNLDYSEGRELLFNSGYDMRTSTYSAPDGTDLSDSPKVRSMFQKAIGEQNLEAVFNKMAREESIQISLAEMKYYKKNGMSDVEPRSFPHYKRIAKAFDKAKKRAWASIKNDNDIQKLLIEERDQKLKNRKANKGTIDKILEMPK